ncbi:MAG: hypothetical protein JNJ57_15015 [Saprospiraceae bacterium]|nr:hypothetical protein [Saprospiraceae bacterium]
MNYSKSISVFVFVLIGMVAQAQNRFTNCSAAFLNDKLVVDEYSPTGKCMLDSTAQGKLTVCTAYLDSDKEKCRPVQLIKFKIAIRDANTKTLMMYSDKTYEKIEISEVMKNCRRGDSIVLLTFKDEYALPHNEILVQ